MSACCHTRAWPPNGFTVRTARCARLGGAHLVASVPCRGHRTTRHHTTCAPRLPPAPPLATRAPACPFRRGLPSPRISAATMFAPFTAPSVCRRGRVGPVAHRANTRRLDGGRAGPAAVTMANVSHLGRDRPVLCPVLSGWRVTFSPYVHGGQAQLMAALPHESRSPRRHQGRAWTWRCLVDPALRLLPALCRCRRLDPRWVLCLLRGGLGFPGLFRLASGLGVPRWIRRRPGLSRGR